MQFVSNVKEMFTHMVDAVTSVASAALIFVRMISLNIKQVVKSSNQSLTNAYRATNKDNTLALNARFVSVRIT